MKKIDNDYILDVLYDLADANGMRIDAFIENLEEQYGGNGASLEGLPEDIAAELNEARTEKKEKRRNERNGKRENEMAEEIKQFRKLFPDVAADDIPQEVWDDVASGATLAHAYALYTVGQNSLSDYADNVNRSNSNRSSAVSGESAEEPSWTREQVEKMSPKDVRSNYKGILKAMKSWRFN